VLLHQLGHELHRIRVRLGRRTRRLVYLSERAVVQVFDLALVPRLQVCERPLRVLTVPIQLRQSPQRARDSQMRRAARAGMGETVTARGCSSHPEGSEPAGAGPPRKWADLSLVLPLQLCLLLESALVDPRDVLQQAAHALHCLRLVRIPLTARRTGAPVFAASMRQGALCVLHSRELRVLRQSGGRRTTKQLPPPPHLRGTRVRSSRVPAACARSVCSDDSSCRIFESASA